MPSIQQKQQFVPPQLEPFISAKRAAFFLINFVTLGIHGAAEATSAKHHVKKLVHAQGDLQRQADKLTTDWDVLIGQFKGVIEQWNDLEYEDTESEFENTLEAWNSIRRNLSGEDAAIKVDVNLSASISEVALGTITFIGQLFANILTLGLYGVYANYVLENRIVVLKAQNDFIQNHSNNQVEEKSQTMQAMADALKQSVNIKKQINGIKNTDAGKAYVAAQKAENELLVLKDLHKNLKRDLNALTVQKVAAEQGKSHVEQDLAALQKKNMELRVRADKAAQLEHDIDTLRAKDIANAQKIANLNVAVNAANVKANRVGELEKEVAALKTGGKNPPELAKLIPKLGSIPPKYTPRPKLDGLLPGAMDDADGMGTPFNEAYKARYNGLRSAAQIAAAGFDYAYDSLIDLAGGGKIKFNNSGHMPGTPGENAVYRLMILDLLKGAKVDENGCHGFKLCINSNVTMLPSQPENILQYKDDSKGGLMPVAVVRYKQRDDFTPDEDTLRSPHGVHPVAAKWILNQLTPKEMDYLFTHLMSSIIENSHPDYIAMRAFMKNSKDPRVKLVMTASELIQDMASAIGLKFSKNVLIPGWQTKADDWDVQPFVKAEDDIAGLDKIADDGIVKTTGTKVVAWELDADVLGDKGAYDKKPRQPEFVQMIRDAHTRYSTICESLDGLLFNPEPVGKSIPNLDWPAVNKQFHISHQMIGADAEFKGGDRCLFSNLLALFVSDQSQLTAVNVQKLKNAMAVYLDKLQNAAVKWAVEKNKDPHLQSKDALKLKEMAELAKSFETAIKKTHGCSVAAYQNFLRKVYGAPVIDLSNLTPLEIQIAAYTIGVRIGILPIRMKVPEATKVDNFGRIVPEDNFIYGPNTKELFLMGISDVGSGTYYGLFPRLNNDYDDPKFVDREDLYNAVFEAFSYWKQIDIHKKG